MPNTILCILAGGRSSRFGGSKLGITVDGTPIIRWQLERIRDAGKDCGFTVDDAWVNLPPGTAGMPAASVPGVESASRIVLDERLYEGPLAGLLAVLVEAELVAKEGCADWKVIVLPADMPLIRPAQVSGLLETVNQGAAIAMSCQADGGVEPLPCVCRVPAALMLVRDAWDQGVRGPTKLAGRPGVVLVPIPHEEAGDWRSINTAQDLHAIAATGRVGKIDRAG